MELLKNSWSCKICNHHHHNIKSYKPLRNASEISFQRELKWMLKMRDTSRKARSNSLNLFGFRNLRFPNHKISLFIQQVYNLNIGLQLLSYFFWYVNLKLYLIWKCKLYMYKHKKLGLSYVWADASRCLHLCPKLHFSHVIVHLT